MNPKIYDIGLLVNTKYTEESLKPIFYTYIHLRADDLQPFYVGKGKGNRAYSKHSRSQHWKNVANKHGLIVKIIYKNLIEEDAFIEEIKLIEKYKYINYPLVNKSTGGEGNTSPRSEEWKKQHSENIKNAAKRGVYKVRSGNKNPFYGKFHSEETKNKISAKMRKQ